MRQRTRGFCCVLLLLLLCSLLLVAGKPVDDALETAPTAAEAEDTLPDVRFHVPFSVVNVQGLDLESLSVTPPDLRVRRTLVPPSNAACDVVGEIPAYPLMKATDRVVAVDGVPISLKTFQDVIDMAIGTTVMLPLFKASADGGDSNILTGFARVEIVRPQSVEFLATTTERVAEVQEWQQAVARKKQEALEREQEERERKAAIENDQVEKEAREKREKEEKYRLEMTPHDQVPVKRRDGKEFRYDVLFVTRGPIGLNWDLLTTDKTVVSHVEPSLAADRAGVIASKDQLIQLNDVDTSTMSPQDVVQVYVKTEPPRRMVFRCNATAAVIAAAAKASGVADPVEKVQNWTVVFDAPVILRGWQTRMHLATWSKEPSSGMTNHTLELALASPMNACGSLPTVGQDVAWLSYRGSCSFVEKAQFAQTSQAKALLVVNNVKGHGRFPAKMPNVNEMELSVGMIGKLDGEIIMAVIEREKGVRFHVEEEDPSQVPSLLPLVPPPPLTNEEMVFRQDPTNAARTLTFWYVNETSVPAHHALSEFRILPALFGGDIPAMPYRIVMAYPQETACHSQGLGVLATRSVILVKRGGCSFGMKAKSVQAVGGAGMLMINTDETLLALMSDPRETAQLTIWAATYVTIDGL